MKIFAIRDDTISKGKNLGFLFYHERTDECFIELCRDVDEWDMPFILDHFVRNGEYVVDGYWTRKWIVQRIVPSDRQNIGAILKEAGMETYEDIKLLIYADGRCAQDDCYIRRVKEAEVPEEIRQRAGQRISEAVLTEQGNVLLLFQDDTTAVIELGKCVDKYGWMKRLLAYVDRLSRMRVSAGGSELVFGEKQSIPYEYLYRNSTRLPIDAASIRKLALDSVVSTKEAMELLNCTRQNIDDLVRRGRLKPLDVNAQNRMFYKKDILAL